MLVFFILGWQADYSIWELVLFLIERIKFHCDYDLYCIMPDGDLKNSHFECVER